jgi:hypothetical protein
MGCFAASRSLSRFEWAYATGQRNPQKARDPERSEGSALNQNKAIIMGIKCNRRVKTAAGNAFYNNLSWQQSQQQLIQRYKAYQRRRRCQLVSLSIFYTVTKTGNFLKQYTH